MDLVATAESLLKRLFFLFLIAACGRADRPGTQPARIDTSAAAVPAGKACKLVTTSDIQHIANIEVAAGITTNDYMGVSQCRYNFANKDAGAILISLHEHGDIENYRTVPGAVEVSDLDDVAVWNPHTGQLAARRGEAVVSISFLYSPADRKMAENLARVALANIR